MPALIATLDPAISIGLTSVATAACIMLAIAGIGFAAWAAIQKIFH